MNFRQIFFSINIIIQYFALQLINIYGFYKKFEYIKYLQNAYDIQ